LTLCFLSLSHIPEHINLIGMYLIQTPGFVQNLFPNFTWKIPSQEKVLYLTFDDGPVPEVTPWVLDLLKQFDAQATFFCVGENIEKHPELFQSILDHGHEVGNHTYNHLDGWNTDNVEYFHNVRKGASMVKTNLFRPPYGKIKPKQVQFLQRHYKIVMWDVLSGDFDDEIDPEQCYNNVVSHANPGSIVVFHDSIKSLSNLKESLPRILQTLVEMGFVFRAIEAERSFVSSPAITFASAL
jgi:peptidoglycan-N-acetylglucosamine deacetylase